MKSKKIEYLDWPSVSTDLNPIENVWGIHVRRVYANGVRYKSVKELNEKIMLEWNKISLDELNKLVDSMPNRVIDVIKYNGGATKY